LRSKALKLTSLIAISAALLAGTLGSRAHATSGAVRVYYAASLLHTNEQIVGPAFQKKTGYTYEGQAAGSLAIANQIKGKLVIPDVVELADPTVNHLLMGAANGNYVSWYFTFARSSLVVGFYPKSRFASRFRAVQRHHLAWYSALEQNGLRIGRTDPNLDPKGYRTLFMAHLAQRVFHLKNFKTRVFGTDENTDQIFPEEVLAARLQSGQLDAGIFYLTEARALHLPYITLPAKINLSSPKYARLYATQHYTTPQGTVTGAPILYTITTPSTVQNIGGAQSFIRYALGKQGRALARSDGLLSTKIVLHGQRGAVPGPLVSYIGK
jgi:molybdate/tungstate transport system substrate-binding protein